MTTLDSPTIFDALAEAEAARDEAFARLDASDYSDETTAILKAIVRTGRRGGEFSANNVRPLLPVDVHTPRIGRAFALAQDLGLIRFVRLTKSTDRGTHGKRVNVYVLTAAGWQ